MIINCICGKKKFRLADELMPSDGSKVRCGSCSEVWFYHPNQGNTPQNQDTISSDETSVNKTFEEPINEEINEKELTTNNIEKTQNEETEKTLNDVDEEELLDETLFEEPENADKKQLSSFKIFTDEKSDLPSKEEMDKNLDNFKIERDKNLNFFQKLFRKDRIGNARKALEKKEADEKYEENNEVDVARRTRLLCYLLILLVIVFSILIVPLREDVSLAFPFLKGYLDFLVPIYEHVKIVFNL